MKKGLIAALAAVLLSCSVDEVSAHNHLIWPVPRDPRQTYAGDNNCESGNGNFPGGQTFQRGQSIKAKWSYNNHRGGFVRFAIVRQGQENQGGIFNRAENIIHYGCHTKTCGGAGVGFDGGDQKPCVQDVKIPTYLPDGNYILQWIVYSMFDSDGNPDKGLPNYLSCANIKIQGGNQSGAPSKCGFAWAGGDKEYTRTNVPKGGDTCAYFMKNTLGKAWDTVKINRSFVKGQGRPAEVEECLRNGGIAQQGTGSYNDNNNNNNNNNNNGGECKKWETFYGDFYCYKMAEHNQISLDQLYQLNPGLNCDALQHGHKICVRK